MRWRYDEPFVASRLSTVYLAAAYAQVVPRYRRRMGLTEIRQSPFAEAAEKLTAGEKVEVIRDPENSATAVN
jgi:hypothetical protein